MADVKIDSKLFQDRLSQLVNAWKADKRSADTVFAGVSSIIVLMGKVEEIPDYGKNNAMHVCLRLDFESSFAMAGDTANLSSIVLAARLRVSYHSDAPNPRYHLHCDDAKEGLVA